eukprot:TRINITY_DN10448_c0_g1_i1.p1 TRINITY_DN10448_c0_g1~~TRINITY_DN10448_c0_g1_i1.p1  ORF type:complete len:415 (+),score=38.85 TRINITY_DN10448_c0_g1_i1:128-1246(+)
MQLPSLQELHLCGNKLKNLQQVSKFTMLKTLDLSDNDISEWREVEHVGQHIKKLQSLLLSANPLSEVYSPQEGVFGQLSCLVLGDCKVSEWRYVSNLDGFPALKKLKLLRNPVLSLIKGKGRYETIARVSGLIDLNNAQIKPLERRDAELRYITRVLENLRGQAIDKEVLQSHPRLQKLIDKYNYLGTHYFQYQDTPSKTLASHMIPVSLKCKIDIQDNSQALVVENTNTNINKNINQDYQENQLLFVNLGEQQLQVVCKKLPQGLCLRKLAVIFQRIFQLNQVNYGLVDHHFVVKRECDGAVEVFKENEGSLELGQIGGGEGLEIMYVLVDSMRGKLEREQQQLRLQRLAQEQLRHGDKMQALQVAEVGGS